MDGTDGCMHAWMCCMHGCVCCMRGAAGVDMQELGVQTRSSTLCPAPCVQHPVSSTLCPTPCVQHVVRQFSVSLSVALNSACVQARCGGGWRSWVCRGRRRTLCTARCRRSCTRWRPCGACCVLAALLCWQRCCVDNTQGAALPCAPPAPSGNVLCTLSVVGGRAAWEPGRRHAYVRQGI